MASRRQRLARLALPLYLFAIYASLGVVRDVTNWLRGMELLRITVGAMFGLAAVLVAALVARTPSLRSARALLLLAVCAGAYGAVIWPMESIEEKVHFLEYGLVALLAHEAAPGRLRGAVRFGAVAVFVLLAGWLDEGIQAVLPSRHYDLRDVVFNAAAGLMALTTLALLRWSASASPSSPPPGSR